jgi:hypothetical protein
MAMLIGGRGDDRVGGDAARLDALGRDVLRAVEAWQSGSRGPGAR